MQQVTIPIIFRHLRGRELRFLTLVALNLLLIGISLDEGLRLAQRPGTGWRTPDLEVLQRRLNDGSLSRREADWYHPARQDPASGSGVNP
jgi:hypothetical protein